MMVNVYATDSSLSIMVRYKKMSPHLKRSLNILSPWMVIIDSDASSQSNSISYENTEYLLETSIGLEHHLSSVALNRNQLDIAEMHCHQCLVNTRRLSVEGKEKITLIQSVLHTYIDLRQCQGDFSGAVSFAEEAYNLVVDAYDPVHPEVQEAAGWLINSLIQLGDFSNAERFAEQTYTNLRDIKNGINQESEIVADGAYNLADVISRQDDGDLIKAEGLVRKVIRIRDQLYDAHFSGVGASYLLFAKVLQKQENSGMRRRNYLSAR
jgi:hypothetical protein